jgi:hypothetical protein
VFLVNLPIGAAVIALTLWLVPSGRDASATRHLDVAGAVTVTAALLLAVYAVINANELGWTSGWTLGMLAIAVLLLAVFVAIEATVKAPLMPLDLLKLRNLATANVIGILWAGAMFAWFFMSALYMQLVLGYGPMEIGLAFLPANIIMAVFSLGLSAKLVMRLGIKTPLVMGLAFATLGLVLFARAPVQGSFALDVLPGMLLLGLGAGIAFNPVLMAAMNDVEQRDSGLASGIVNTAFMMGGALGLAVLASLAAARSHDVAQGGGDIQTALAQGYGSAFLTGAVFAALAAGCGAFFLRARQVAAHAGE